MAQPIARCRCGYELLAGQDCPECGRSFALAQAIEQLRRVGIKAACAGLTAVSIVLLGFSVLMFAIVVGQNLNHPVAERYVIPAIIAWIIAVFPLLASLLLASVPLTRHGFSGLLCFILIADVVLLAPPMVLLVAIIA